MSTRDDVHRLVDEIAPDRLDDAATLLRQVAEESAPEQPRRTFGSLGAGRGPSDLGERAKEIARQELGEGRKSA